MTNIYMVDPSDGDTIGDHVANFLNTSGDVALVVGIIVFVLSLIIAIVVSKKAGYSGWWGAIGVLVPPLGLILAILLALLKWPALMERDEALGILKSQGLTLPSRERRAIKDAERRKRDEVDARKQMEKAQVGRRRADAERARFQASEDKADEAPTTPPADADKPDETGA